MNVATLTSAIMEVHVQIPTGHILAHVPADGLENCAISVQMYVKKREYAKIQALV